MPWSLKKTTCGRTCIFAKWTVGIKHDMFNITSFVSLERQHATPVVLLHFLLAFYSVSYSKTFSNLLLVQEKRGFLQYYLDQSKTSGGGILIPYKNSSLQLESWIQVSKYSIIEYLKFTYSSIQLFHYSNNQKLKFNYWSIRQRCSICVSAALSSRKLPCMCVSPSSSKY
jgi:hypothetical protein